MPFSEWIHVMTFKILDTIHERCLDKCVCEICREAGEILKCVKRRGRVVFGALWSQMIQASASAEGVRGETSGFCESKMTTKS